MRQPVRNLDIKIERWPVDRLIPSAANPRMHSPEQLAQIAGSIQAFGFVNPVLVAPSGQVIAGEGRLRAAKTLGMREVPVIVLQHLTEAQRRALAIADNQIPLGAGWDDALLRDQLAALQDEGFNLDLLGFDDEELAGRMAALEAAAPADEDAVPDMPASPVSRLTDLWLLGSGKGRRQQRVLCGDATSTEAVTRLLANAQSPVLMVTDPPFGVGLDPVWREKAGLNPRTVQGGRIANDDRVDWSAAWILFPGDVVYLWHGGLYAAETALSLQSCGFQIRAQIIWVKQHFAISRGSYHWQHEPCWYAVRRGQSANWRGGRKQSTLWELPNLNPFGGNASGEDEVTGHGAQKPVELMRRPILNHTRAGEACYDPFLGSGSTLIAAESVGRICYGMDIDPRYVDVAVLRWQRFTGQNAALDGDGRTFEQIAQLRRREVA